MESKNGFDRLHSHNLVRHICCNRHIEDIDESKRPFGSHILLDDCGCSHHIEDIDESKRPFDLRPFEHILLDDCGYSLKLIYFRFFMTLLYYISIFETFFFVF